jgi:hypothetical protein
MAEVESYPGAPVPLDGILWPDRGRQTLFAGVRRTWKCIASSTTSRRGNPARYLYGRPDV